MFTVLITGATSGIGKALALEYASERVKLILLGRKQSSLESIRLLCEKQGAKVQLYCCDLSSVQESQSISSLTNSTQDGEIETWEAVESLLMVNLLGSLAISHPVLEGMQQRKAGHIALC